MYFFFCANLTRCFWHLRLRYVKHNQLNQTVLEHFWCIKNPPKKRDHVWDLPLGHHAMQSSWNLKFKGFLAESTLKANLSHLQKLESLTVNEQYCIGKQTQTTWALGSQYALIATLVHLHQLELERLILRCKQPLWALWHRCPLNFLSHLV